MGTYGDADAILQKAGVSPGDIQDADTDANLSDLVARLNERASEAVERWANRDFEDHADETVKLDGNGRLNDNGNGQLKLPGQPVRSIAEIKVGDTTLDSSDYRLIKPSAYDGDTPVGAGIVERKNMPFPEGWENVEVTYTWGYEEPPAGVRQVVEDLVVDRLRSASRNETAETAESISMDGYSVSFFSTEIENEERHKERLKPYRKMALARS